jgi:hypothetical protein
MLRHHSSWTQYIHRQPVWRCNSEHMHESEALFSTPDHLRGHVRALHEGIWSGLDDTSIVAPAEGSVVDVLRKPNTCPLCCLTPKSMESLDYSSEEITPVPRAMVNHIAEHLQNLMVLSLRLMETQNEEPDGDSKGGSMTPNESRQGSLVDHSEADSDSDELPLPPFGSPTVRPESPALNDGEPPKTDAQDWSIVTEETRRQHPELDDDTDSILDHLRTLQETLPETEPATSSTKAEELERRYERTGKMDDLGWLSPTDFPAQQHDIITRRQEGTGQWFLDSPEFKGWLQGSDKTLFCPGIPGAGKTMMAAIAIDHLCRTVRRDDIGVTYLFCNYKAQADQSAPNLLTALLKQLVQSRPDIAAPVTHIYDKHLRWGSRPSLDDIFGALQSVCSNYATVYIVVDALDECAVIDRGRLINNLHELQARTDVRLMCTSRFIPEIDWGFYLNLTLEVRASEKDVRRFVSGQMPRLPNCIRRDDELKRAVQNKIVEAVDGM